MRGLFACARAGCIRAVRCAARDAMRRLVAGARSVRRRGELVAGAGAGAGSAMLLTMG